VDITLSATTRTIDGLGYAVPVVVERGSPCFGTSNVPVIEIALGFSQYR